MRKEAIFIQKSIRVIFTAVYLIIFVSSILLLSKTGQSASARTLLSPFPTQIRTEPPPPTSTPPPSPCTSWNLASDFRISPNQENPNRDSCNNLGIWEFMGSSGLDRVPATYYPMSTFTASGGLNMWQGNNGEGHISFNASGVDYIAGAIIWPANTVDVHPGLAQMVVMAWHSPVSGYISVTGSVSDNNPHTNCTSQDGILWYIDKNSTNIASGGFVNGDGQTFASGTNGINLNTLSVVSGDVIYLAIHPGGNFNCDDTFVDLAINVTSAPTSTPTATITYTPTPTSTVTSIPTLTPLPSNGYNRIAAVAYADDWAHGRNPLYPFWYGTGCDCNDCTNYVSQVLHNGGLSLRPGTYYDDISEWWYRTYLLDASQTWSVTNWLYDYTHLYRTEFDSNAAVEDLQGGDFILIDVIDNSTHDPIPDGKPDHARVVVGYGDTSIDPAEYTCIPVEEIPTEVEYNVLLVNQHCTDRKHVAWNFRIEDVRTFFVHVTR